MAFSVDGGAAGKVILVGEWRPERGAAGCHAMFVGRGGSVTAIPVLEGALNRCLTGYRNVERMKIYNLLEAGSRSEFREWLMQNHRRETECWVEVKRGGPKDDGTFWYIDAVEEALCFGWIDSTTKKISDEMTVQRFCPRRPVSNWSELNKERCRRMERLGLMTDAGRAVLPDMSDAGFTIDEDILQELRADHVAWENFCRFPELYKRVRIDTIQIKKHRPELFRRRLDKFMENTRKGILYGEWNDNGRLWQREGQDR